MTTINIPRTARTATHLTLINDGATVSAVTGASPTSGYAVARPGREETYTLAVDPRVSTVELIAIIESYVDRHRADLAWPGRYLGTWLHDGKIYLDVSEVIGDLETALQTGLDRSQIAIFDLAHGIEIECAALEVV